MSEAKRYSTDKRPFLEVASRGGQIVLRIRQATEQGYIECDSGGVADLAYPSSQLRRARVKDRGKVCGTLMSDNQQFCIFVEYDL
jgi:DNA (cytosine-5)-methyltransferase 1